MGQIPDELRGTVDDWVNRPSSRDIRIPVDMKLIFDMVYGSQSEEKFNRLMARTNRIAQRATILASSKKDFSLIPESRIISMDSTHPNFLIKLYPDEFSTKAA